MERAKIGALFLLAAVVIIFALRQKTNDVETQLSAQAAPQPKKTLGSMVGSADSNGDGKPDRRLQHSLIDTNGDGKTDIKEVVSEEDKNGDGDFEDPGERETRTDLLTTHGMLEVRSPDGKQRIRIEGEDTDGDGRFDKVKKTVIDVSLNQTLLETSYNTKAPLGAGLTTRDVLPARAPATTSSVQKRTVTLTDVDRNGTFGPMDGVGVATGQDLNGDGTFDLIGTESFKLLLTFALIRQLLTDPVVLAAGGSIVSTPTATSMPVQQPYALALKDRNLDGVVDASELAFDPPGTTFVASVTNAVDIPLVFPFFFTSDTFNTTIMVSNPSKSESRAIQATAFDPDGTLLGTAFLRLAPLGQLTKDIRELFPMLSRTAHGGIVMKADGSVDAFQSFDTHRESFEVFDVVNPLPVLAAAARGMTELTFTLPFVVDDDSAGSGLGLFNSDLGLHSKASTVKLDLVSWDGVLLASTQLELSKNRSFAKTLGELFPGKTNYTGSLRISATAPVFGFGSFFRKDGKDLAIVGLSFHGPERKGLEF